MSTRRAFLTTLGVGIASARLARAQQSPPAGRGDAAPPVRKVKTTPLFKSPEGYPNAMAVAPEGLWIAEQKSDNAHLVDWNGKLLKTIKTESKNTSGMGYGAGCIWMGANAAPEGIFQTDMNSKTVTHRQIPLGPGENGGGCHGVEYVDGKLWIAALRLRGILRVDAKTWQPELLIPYSFPRAHGVAWEKGAIWMVTGGEHGAGVVKYDATTGRVLETAQFADEASPFLGLAGLPHAIGAGRHRAGALLLPARHDVAPLLELGEVRRIYLAALEEARRRGARDDDVVRVRYLACRGQDERDYRQDVPEWRKHGATSSGSPSLQLGRCRELGATDKASHRDRSPSMEPQSLGGGERPFAAPSGERNVRRPRPRKYDDAANSGSDVNAETR